MFHFLGYLYINKEEKRELSSLQIHIMRLSHLVFIITLLLIPHTGYSQGFTVYVGKVHPFTIVGDTSGATGAAVDVVSELMERAGHPIDTGEILSISWARAVEDTETKPGTMLFCVARTPQREQKFKWVGPIAELNLGLVANRHPRIVINDERDVKKYSIGVVRNSAPMQILENSYGVSPSSMRPLASDEFQFKMLHERRVDLITQADTAAPSWIKKMNLDQSDFEMVHVIKHLQLYIAFNKETDDALIESFQAALDGMKMPNGDGVSRYNEIMKEYLADGPIAQQ